jgi:4-hydroxybenzoate polyprenyltransferase
MRGLRGLRGLRGRGAADRSRLEAAHENDAGPTSRDASLRPREAEPGRGAANGGRREANPGPRETNPGQNPWVELLRLPALFTVPGDALAGAAAAGARPNPRTLLAITSSLCLYEAGMALNDWADRTEDAVDRPHRPLPSGRITPPAALAAAGGLTAAGLALAARAGRRPVAVAGALAATVWSYDLVLKRTPAGPLAMATARALDLLLGATATNGDTRRALPSALALGTHTLAVTTVSRHETQGGSPWAPLTALATTTALTWAVTHSAQARDQAGGSTERIHRSPVRYLCPVGARGCDIRGSYPTLGFARAGGPPSWARRPATDGPQLECRTFSGALSRVGGRHDSRPAHGPGAGPAAPTSSSAEARASTPGPGAGAHASTQHAGTTPSDLALRGALAAAYAATAARPLFHAALNPSPPLTQRAVGGGIRAMIPLQAALAARSGAPITALLTAALAPAARKFSRRVSLT